MESNIYFLLTVWTEVMHVPSGPRKSKSRHLTLSFSFCQWGQRLAAWDARAWVLKFPSWGMLPSYQKHPHWIFRWKRNFHCVELLKFGNSIVIAPSVIFINNVDMVTAVSANVGNTGGRCSCFSKNQLRSSFDHSHVPFLGNIYDSEEQGHICLLPEPSPPYQLAWPKIRQLLCLTVVFASSLNSHSLGPGTSLGQGRELLFISSFITSLKYQKQTKKKILLNYLRKGSCVPPSSETHLLSSAPILLRPV